MSVREAPACESILSIRIRPGSYARCIAWRRTAAAPTPSMAPNCRRPTPASVARHALALRSSAPPNRAEGAFGASERSTARLGRPVLARSPAVALPVSDKGSRPSAIANAHCARTVRMVRHGRRAPSAPSLGRACAWPPSPASHSPGRAAADALIVATAIVPSDVAQMNERCHIPGW
jgi:hypothetical protein